MQRSNRNSVAVKIEREFKAVNERTLLVKVTTEMYSLVTDSPLVGYHYNNEATVTRAITANTPKTNEQLFLIRIPKKLKVEVFGDTDLLLGPVGQCKHSANSRIGQAKYKLSDKKTVICLELKGKNATLWDETKESQINHLVTQIEGNYTSPVFEEKSFEIKTETEGINIGRKLELHKLSNDSVLASGGKLIAHLSTDKMGITANLGHGTILTYGTGKGTISRDVEPGTYLVTLQQKPETAYDYRRSVIDAASEVDVESETGRLDFLTKLDIAHENSAEGDFWSNRIGHDKSIKIDNSITTNDDVLDRI